MLYAVLGQENKYLAIFQSCVKTEIGGLGMF